MTLRGFLVLLLMLVRPCHRIFQHRMLVFALSASPSMHNAMLTSQVRFLYDLFIYRPSLPREDLLYADVGVDVVDELLDSFKRSKVEIQNVAEEFTCCQRFGCKLVANSRVTERASESLADGNCWDKDPRLECLGFRGIFPSDTIRNALG